MQPERPLDPVQRVDSQPAPQGGLVSDIVPGPITASPIPPPQPSIQPDPDEPAAVVLAPRPKLSLQLRLIVVGLVAVLLLAGGAFVFTQRNKQAVPVQAGSFGVVRLPLDKLAVSPGAGETIKSLKVNGNLQITNSLILAPISQPDNPVIGQLYYDQTSNLLRYYNSQAFVDLGPTGGVTNITNILGSGSGSNASAVQLQTTSPGVQQTGNFNVSGTGTVGTLKTSVIDSSGTSLFINPRSTVGTVTQPGGTPATLGLISGSQNSGGTQDDVLIATKATLGDTGGTATSITVFLVGGSAANHIQVGLYEDDGDIPSKPAALLAASAVVNIVPNAFNTITIPSVVLSPNNTYWMAFNTDDTTVNRQYNANSNISCFITSGFGFMPDPFSPPGCFASSQQYAIYTNYITSAGAGGAFGKSHLSISPTGQALFQNSENSSTAFQVQNALGTSTVFNIDTINGRIAIGKANAAYRLDVAGGDINLSNNRSIRFGGVQALSSAGSGSITALTNFASGGTVVAQGENFSVQDASGLHENLTIDNNGAATFSNRINTTAGFQIQNATGTPLLRADTVGMKLFVGNPAGDANPVVLYLANKNTAGDPVGAEGGTYYNSTLGSFRCFYSGFWRNCADIEPQHGFSLYDEFIGGQTSFTGNIGSLGWNALAIGANGSLALNPATPPPSANRPGVLRLRTPAVSNQGTTLALGDAGGGSMIIAKDNHLKTAVAVGAATGQVLRIGLHNETSATTQPTSGVWWEADPGSGLDWRYCYGDGTTATCTSAVVGIAANTWMTLEIRVTATGAGTSAATFVINNTAFTVNAVTIDTTNSVFPALSSYATTGTAADCFWDYFQLTGTTSATR